MQPWSLKIVNNILLSLFFRVKMILCGTTSYIWLWSTASSSLLSGCSPDLLPLLQWIFGYHQISYIFSLAQLASNRTQFMRLFSWKGILTRRCFISTRMLLWIMYICVHTTSACYFAAFIRFFLSVLVLNLYLCLKLQQQRRSGKQ